MREAVTNATDGDWADNLEALKANGINVHFHCVGSVTRHVIDTAEMPVLMTH